MKKQQRTSKPKALPAVTLDAMHNNGVDLSSRMDLTKATRPGRAVQRVNVDFPVDLLRDRQRQPSCNSSGRVARIHSTTASRTTTAASCTSSASASDVTPAWSYSVELRRLR